MTFKELACSLDLNFWAWRKRAGANPQDPFSVDPGVSFNLVVIL